MDCGFQMYLDAFGVRPGRRYCKNAIEALLPHLEGEEHPAARQVYEVAYLSKWITKEQISTLSKKFGKNSYVNYLR